MVTKSIKILAYIFMLACYVRIGIFIESFDLHAAYYAAYGAFFGSIFTSMAINETELIIKKNLTVMEVTDKVRQ